MTVRAARIRFADMFRSEIAEAKALGYTPQVDFGDDVITVRLVPRTERAMRNAKTAAPEGTMDPCIHAAVDKLPSDVAGRLDALRETFASALVLARDAA